MQRRRVVVIPCFWQGRCRIKDGALAGKIVQNLIDWGELPPDAKCVIWAIDAAGEALKLSVRSENFQAFAPCGTAELHHVPDYWEKVAESK